LTPLRPNHYLEIPGPPFPPLIIRKRSGHEVVSRIRTVPPRRGEIFYLRPLLLHKPAFSFEHLRSVGDTIHQTFHEAAAALGLFQNTNKTHHTLTTPSAAIPLVPATFELSDKCDSSF